MKKIILSLVVAVAAMFATAGTAEAGSCCKQTRCVKKCCPKKSCAPRRCCKPRCCKSTVEVCRRYFCKTKCVCGCPKSVRYVEVTYRSTDRRCRTKTFKKVYRV